MIVAAAVVAALCLTAVTSVTQSWFSDEEHATVDVTTGKVDIRAEAGDISLYSLGVEVSAMKALSIDAPFNSTPWVWR